MSETIESKIDEVKVGRHFATVRIAWKVDDTADLDFLGKYVGSWEEGAIDISKHRAVKESEFRFFVSANNSKFDKKDWAHVPGKEKRDVIKKYGSLANATRAYAKQDFDRAEAYNNGEWHMTGCVVTVTIGKTKARNSIWGIESDCGGDYRREIERECLGEAVYEMKEKLKGTNDKRRKA